ALLLAVTEIAFAGTGGHILGQGSHDGTCALQRVLVAGLLNLAGVRDVRPAPGADFLLRLVTLGIAVASPGLRRLITTDVLGFLRLYRVLRQAAGRPQRCRVTRPYRPEGRVGGQGVRAQRQARLGPGELHIVVAVDPVEGFGLQPGLLVEGDLDGHGTVAGVRHPNGPHDLTGAVVDALADTGHDHLSVVVRAVHLDLGVVDVRRRRVLHHRRRHAHPRLFTVGRRGGVRHLGPCTRVEDHFRGLLTGAEDHLDRRLAVAVVRHRRRPGDLGLDAGNALVGALKLHVHRVDDLLVGHGHLYVQVVGRERHGVGRNRTD